MANLHPSPGPGRPKGSQNKITKDVRALIDSIFEQHDPVETACRLLTCGQPQTEARVWQILMEYRYGKPKENGDGSEIETFFEELPVESSESKNIN